MQRAINETERRRAKQIAFNEANGIVPTQIRKKVADVMDLGQDTPSTQRKVAQPAAEYKAATPQQLSAQIKKLEGQMLQHAKNLEFEQAAVLRDQVLQLKAKLLEIDR